MSTGGVTSVRPKVGGPLVIRVRSESEALRQPEQRGGKLHLGYRRQGGVVPVSIHKGNRVNLVGLLNVPKVIGCSSSMDKREVVHV